MGEEEEGEGEEDVDVARRNVTPAVAKAMQKSDNEEENEGSVTSFSQYTDVKSIYAGKWAQRSVPKVKSFMASGPSSTRNGDHEPSSTMHVSHSLRAVDDHVIKSLELRAKTVKELQKIKKHIMRLDEDHDNDEVTFIKKITDLYPHVTAKKNESRREAILKENRVKLENLFGEHTFRADTTQRALRALMEWCSSAREREVEKEETYGTTTGEGEEGWTLDGDMESAAALNERYAFVSHLLENTASGKTRLAGIHQGIVSAVGNKAKKKRVPC